MEMRIMKGAIVAVNWVTGKVEHKFLGGEDVEGRALAGISGYHRSGGGHEDWTHAYIHREPRDPEEAQKVMERFNEDHLGCKNPRELEVIHQLCQFLDDNQVAKVLDVLNSTCLECMNHDFSKGPCHCTNDE